MPILADISVPWIIVAMIFISFIRFLLEKIRGPELLEEEDEEDWTRRSQPGGRPTTRTDTEGPAGDPGEELRRFLETLREGEEEPAETAPPHPTRTTAKPEPQPASPPPPPPPPPPATAESPRERPLTDEQRAAARAFRSRETSPTDRGTRRSTASPRSAASFLRDPESIRNAIVLREVLGPPLALRERDEPWY